MNTISRRTFLKLFNRALAATGAAAIFAPIVAYFYPTDLQETPTEPVLVSKVDELPANQSKMIRFGRYPALVINSKDGLRAYSAVCTHFACLVKWNPDTEQIFCPCHAGFFDPQDGHVLAGPPPIPLTSIPVKIVNNEIYVGGEV
jgi:cytochrome b6-f complex iron-sulfur subunit